MWPTQLDHFGHHHAWSFRTIQAFPRSKDPKLQGPLKICKRMALQGLTEFDADNFENVKKYLGKKKIHGMDSLMDHFYFNREWWYRRVRVFPPASGRVNAIFYFSPRPFRTVTSSKWCGTKSNLGVKRRWNCAASGSSRSHMICRMYQWDRVDQNGLDLYIWLRGSN